MIASRPSGAWFGHVLELWPKFRVRSFKELDANRVALHRPPEFLAAGMPFGAQDVERKKRRGARRVPLRALVGVDVRNRELAQVVVVVCDTPAADAVVRADVGAEAESPPDRA